MKKWIVIFGIWLMAGQAQAAEILVFAAASLTDALAEIGRDFGKEGAGNVRYNLGSSSMLARQIIAGAPADVFCSADEEKMDQLEHEGLVKAGTRHSLLSNRLVVVVFSESKLVLQSPNDLIRLKRIALAETKTVPAGIYARKYLEGAGVWPEIEKIVVPTENVRGALAAVEAGNVDAAIVYKTDAAISKKAKIAYEVPERESPNISYSAAVMKEAPNEVLAVKFLNYLRAEKASDVFKKYGFLTSTRD